MAAQGPDAGDATVVVGVDGSEPSRRALAWAATEAQRRDIPLRIVYAFPFPPSADASDAAAQKVRGELGEAAEWAREVAGSSLDVDIELLDGLPADVLTAESQRSALVVVGGRGHGGFEHLLLGSTAVQVTEHAVGPVAVVPDRGDVGGRTGPVIVGVDDSASAEPAVAFGFARAAERGAPLVALSVWQPPTAYGVYGAAELLRTDPDRIESERRTRLDATLEPWRDRYPQVEVHARVARGQVVAELVKASATAETVVVGARGRSAMAGMLLGSVSQGLLRHTEGPVVVAR